MTYRFAGYFARPPVAKPAVLRPEVVWKEIERPFVGVGVRLPAMIGRIPPLPTVLRVAHRLGLASARRWLYLTYECWGGQLDFVYGILSLEGEVSRPVEESEANAVEAAYTGLMERFGLTEEQAFRFEPFERGYWDE